MKPFRPGCFRRRRIPVFLLILILCLSGCTVKPLAPSPQYEAYTAAPQEPDPAAVQAEFDAFTDNLFREEVAKSTITLHSLIADPASMGIQEAPVSFGSVSLEDRKADMADTKELLKALEDFPPELLTSQQKLTYDILKSYLDTALLSDGLELYDQNLAPTIGIQAQLPVLLAEYVFYSKADIDTYLSLLSTIDDYYGQLCEFEKARADAGLSISDGSLDSIITSCEAYLIDPADNFITQTFDERLETVDGLTDEEKEAYRARHVKILEEHFVPAYQNMIRSLDALKGTGVNEQGMCGYPDGKAYYEYLIHAVTGTSYPSVDDLKAAIESRMKNDLMAAASVLQEYPDILSQVYDYPFQPSEPSEILEHLQTQITADFPALPPCRYTVKDIPKALELSLSPAFYILPPLDRYEDNIIYINRNERFQDEPLYPTLAHEGYPGHLYQTVYFINKNPSLIRHLISFGSFTEGWATYVEFQSYFFDNGLNEGLQKLLMHNRSFLLGVHAYLDLAINYYGWTKEEVGDFLSQHYMIEEESMVNEFYQTMLDNPANYLEYYVGYLEISSMRQKAEETLKDRFNAREFHTFLLDIGSAPFTVIRPRFEDWLKEQKA